LILIVKGYSQYTNRAEMQIQSNPFLIWQLIPALATLWLGLYVKSRTRKKPESNTLALMLFAESAWSLFSAIQLFSPNSSWQIFWHSISFFAIVIIPTAWFMLAVKFTGYLRERVTKVEATFYLIPILTLLAILTNGRHLLFFKNSFLIIHNGFASLAVVSGPLFLIHTWYSYLLVFLGVLLLCTALVKNFKKYGIQAYGLIIGVFAPLIGNVLYLAGTFPTGFPDPTPLAFTVTSITIAWAIFAGRMLDAVPIAHETIITNLPNGVIILDQENKIMDINLAARQVLELDQRNIYGRSIGEFLNPEIDVPTGSPLKGSETNDPPTNFIFTPQTGKNTYEVSVSTIRDKYGQASGKILQITDISRQKQIEKNLATSQEKLVSILDTLKDYYFETDARGYLVNINKAFYEHLGYSRKEDLIGKHLRHFTDRKSMRDVFLNFSKVIDTRETIELFRYTYRTRNGKEYIGETNVSPIMEGDEVVGARGVLRNITEKVVAEENLRQAKEVAENRVRELSAINRIATISSNSLELENILQQLCVELTNIFPVRNAGIGLISDGTGGIQIVAFHTSDPLEKSHLGRVLSLSGPSPAREAVDKKKAVVKHKLQKGVKSGLLDFAVRSDTCELLIVPLITRGNVIGTIGMPASDSSHSFSDYEIRLVETIAIQIAAAIDNANLFTKTESALDVAAQDLEIGRQIQAGFFPDAIPDIPGWEIAAHFEPARQVSGDFYDFFKFDKSNMTALVIADVCDKGVGAALFMVLFRSLLRAFGKMDVDPENAKQQLKNIISNTNNYIAAIHGKSNMFATIFFGILDPDSGTLYYVNGGHLPPAIMDKNGTLVHRLPPTGPAVGLFLDVDYRVEEVNLNKGDFLVGFTDGTTDAQNDEGQLFTEERLLKYMQTPWSSLFSMMVELKNELHVYKHGRKQFDDITLISIRRKMSLDREQHAICRVADENALSDLMDFVDGSAVQGKLDPEDAVAVRQVVEAACSAIILKGFDADKPGLLSLFFETDPGQVRIIIRDDGRFLASLAEIQTTEFPFAKVDHISYGRMEEKGNQLVIEKKLQHQVREDAGVWNYIQTR
jgi:PAS domain S-box-containing protein